MNLLKKKGVLAQKECKTLQVMSYSPIFPDLVGIACAHVTLAPLRNLLLIGHVTDLGLQKILPPKKKVVLGMPI